MHGKASRKKKVESDYQPVIDLWNQIVLNTPFPTIISITGKRKKDLDERLNDPAWLPMLEEATRYLLCQDWCCGRTDRKWIADFDYIIRDGMVQKYCEKARAGQFTPQPVMVPDAIDREIAQMRLELANAGR